jgi:hypothetical protein
MNAPTVTGEALTAARRLLSQMGVSPAEPP